MPVTFRSAGTVITATIITAGFSGTAFVANAAAPAAGDACSFLTKADAAAAMYKMFCAEKTKEGLSGLGDGHLLV